MTESGTCMWRRSARTHNEQFDIQYLRCSLSVSAISNWYLTLILIIDETGCRMSSSEDKMKVMVMESCDEGVDDC